VLRLFVVNEPFSMHTQGKRHCGNPNECTHG
ncbi:uncharacterized protein METZ01_LOCUS235143, partial [marine metagenome]